MTPKGHAIPSKTQLLSYGTPAFCRGFLKCYIRNLAYDIQFSNQRHFSEAFPPKTP